MHFSFSFLIANRSFSSSYYSIANFILEVFEIVCAFLTIQLESSFQIEVMIGDILLFINNIACFQSRNFNALHFTKFLNVEWKYFSPENVKI